MTVDDLVADIATIFHWPPSALSDISKTVGGLLS
ncbi:GpE family phage tail protein [Escherichia coli]|nr:GpE family phage tail protein [Escherichia coli]